MNIICNQCQASNNSTSLFCFDCQTALTSHEAILSIILQRQQELEGRYQEETRALKVDIDCLRNAIYGKDKIIDKHKAANPAIANTAPKEVQWSGKAPTRKKVIQPKPKKKREPSALYIKVKQVISPLSEGLNLAFGIYEKYKSEGKLPIFFMTIMGIIAILFGFGYLMQSSFHYLGIYEQIAKIFLGFASAIAIGIFGMRLYKKDSKWEEYGSALIGLAIILNYLMLYFLSDLGKFPVLSSATLGFMLIIANTAVGALIALKFETKIVSVLSLVGGALAPFYLNANGDGSMYYFYLWLLTVSAIYIAYQIKWRMLNYIAFVVSMFLVETVVFQYFPNSILFNIYYHLFAYLFFYIALFDKTLLKESLDKTDIYILAGSLSLFLFNLYSANQGELVLFGLILLGNFVLISSYLFFRWSVLSGKNKLIFFMMSGLLLGLAIPALFDQALFGLFWSAEAVALIIIGFAYSLPMIRKEGYIVLLFAIFKLAYSSQSLILNWGGDLLHLGFLNYLILGAVITTLWQISKRYKKQFESYEHVIFSTCSELVPIWASSVLLIVGYATLGNWGLNLAIFPLFGMIYWQKHFGTRYSAVIGIAHVLFFLLILMISFDETNSYRMSNQMWYAKAAMISFMFSLWTMQYFFEYIGHMSERLTYQFSKSLRVLFFFLIPVIFLLQIKRHAFEYMDIGLWISVLITYIIHVKTKYRAIFFELNGLILLAVIFHIMNMNNGATLTSIGILGLIIGLERNHLVSDSFQYKILVGLTPFIAAFSMATLHFNLVEDNPATMAGLIAAQLMAVVYFKNNINGLKSIHFPALILSVILSLFGLLYLFVDSSAMGNFILFVNLVLLGLLLHNHHNWFNLPKQQRRWNVLSITHQLQITLFYTMMLDVMSIDVEGVALSILLVVHAIFLLFVSMKNDITVLSKSAFVFFGLAILKVVSHDISDFAVGQKIVVFIAIGILLLGASFLYVRLKAHFDKHIKD